MIIYTLKYMVSYIHLYTASRGLWPVPRNAPHAAPAPSSAVDGILHVRTENGHGKMEQLAHTAQLPGEKGGIRGVRVGLPRDGARFAPERIPCRIS